MKCKLCLQDKPLIKKSHIIPDFMYKGLFDDKHFINYFDIFNPSNHKKLPAGIYDKQILCSTCDNEIISRYEDYASQVLYNSKNLHKKENLQFRYVKIEDCLNSILISNIDYNKFKLFLLSILWRAHISNNVFFKEVDLGLYADEIREMLLNGDAGSENIFETCLVYFKTNDVPVNGIGKPKLLKASGNTCYIFLINKILYFFNISKINKLPIIAKGHLTKDNKMEVAVLEKDYANNFFDKFLGKRIRI